MKKIIVILLSVFFLTHHTHAFDNQRKGFILGLGAGPQNTKIDSGSLSLNKTGIQSSFKIGWGINDQLLVYYLAELSWLAPKNKFEPETKYKGKTTCTSGFSPLGLSYYLKPTSPSLFFNLGIGLGQYMCSTPSGDLDSLEWGGAFLIGLGYEFQEHVSIEGKLISSSMSVNNNIDKEMLSYMLTLNYLWY